jgi:hypothetical protein
LIVPDLPIEWVTSSGIPFGLTVIVTAIASVGLVGGAFTYAQRDSGQRQRQG